MCLYKENLARTASRIGGDSLTRPLLLAHRRIAIFRGAY